MSTLLGFIIWLRNSEEVCRNVLWPCYTTSLLVGRNIYHYLDKSITIEKFALVFSNPMIPYQIEFVDDQQKGYFCVFTESFLSHFIDIKLYPVFMEGSNPVLYLTDDQLNQLIPIYESFFKELQSDYKFKYDMIRVLLLQLIHNGIRLSADDGAEVALSFSANQRTSALFFQLLEQQFRGRDAEMSMIKLKTAADFASELHFHVNSLNRTVKAVTGKTTSIHVKERILQEARVLLKYSEYNISEIGNYLGFEDFSHFSTFFRKNTGHTPGAFRS